MQQVTFNRPFQHRCLFTRTETVREAVTHCFLFHKKKTLSYYKCEACIIYAYYVYPYVAMSDNLFSFDALFFFLIEFPNGVALFTRKL